MFQGLLGGFRVMLDALVGTDLATGHGIFAQIVFSLLISIAVLTGRPSTGFVPSRSLTRLAAALVAILFLQIVFGAFVRHSPTALVQRLHYLTAFVATALAVGVILAIMTRPAARQRAGLWAPLLAIILVCQLVLGVEAWMAKFGSYTLPELVKITTWYGAIRTAHALVGSGLFATSLIIALRLRVPRSAGVRTPSERTDDWYEPPADPARVETLASAFRRDAP
jgi:heme A synthase